MSSPESSLWSSMAGNALGGSTSKMASPWQDYASKYVPSNMRNALELTEILYYRSGVYKAATERIVDYFLTKLILASKDDDARKKMERIMVQDFGVMEALRNIAIDRKTYGNSFVSIHLPFKRVLRCVHCSNEQAMVTNSGDFIDFKFEKSESAFYLHCKSKTCGKQIRRHKVRDYPVRDASKVRTVRWDPKRIDVEYVDITGDKRFWLTIDPDIISRVNRGDPFTLACLPWSFITAIRNNQKYRFNSDHIFHSTESSLAGVNLRGWGVPPILASFRNFFRVQLLLRYDEVMKMDYVVPLRIVSPSITKSSAGNGLMEINLRNFTQEAAGAVERHRIDGADWNFFPFPINYQAVGGEGLQLDQAQRNSIMEEEDRLLNVRGIPPELYRGSMQLVNAPVGLRLFESGNSSLVNDLNRILQWMTTTVGHHMDCGQHEAHLDRVTLTDNLDDKVWRINAASTGIISKETGLGPLGIDPREEGRRILDEQMEAQREQQKAEREMQMSQLSLGSQESDSQGSAGGEMRLDDIQSQADEWAKSLLAPEVTEQQRRQQLAAIHDQNETLHALVIQKLQEYRQQAGNIGRDTGLAQMGVGQKGASLMEQASLMDRLNTEFPLGAGDIRHSIQPQKSGRLVVTVNTKTARRAVIVPGHNLANELEDVISYIKGSLW